MNIADIKTLEDMLQVIDELFPELGFTSKQTNLVKTIVKSAYHLGEIKGVNKVDQIVIDRIVNSASQHPRRKRST